MNNNVDERMIECFLGEIKRQCEYVFTSVNILNDSLGSNGNAQGVFYALQNMFTSLGNISKILYPTVNYRARGCALRDKLEIKEDTQFFYKADSEVARKYRNILEHYDEYFEDWYRNEENNIICECNVGPRNMIMIGDKPDKTLRHYDNVTHSFIFLDDEYSLLPVIRETEEIYNKILEIEGEGFGYRQE